jgi:hypothetical protein
MVGGWTAVLGLVLLQGGGTAPLAEDSPQVEEVSPESMDLAQQRILALQWEAAQREERAAQARAQLQQAITQTQQRVESLELEAQAETARQERAAAYRAERVEALAVAREALAEVYEALLAGSTELEPRLSQALRALDAASAEAAPEETALRGHLTNALTFARAIPDGLPDRNHLDAQTKTLQALDQTSLALRLAQESIERP